MLRATTDYVRQRLRQRGELIPLGFSWPFVVTVDVSLLLIALVATLERSTADLPIALAATAVALAPLVLFFVSGISFKPFVLWATSTSATVLFLFGTSAPMASDYAPLILVLMVGVVCSLTPLLAEHAAADERRRIAREVHDVIAHSLSITLLHLTGARRGLQQDADIDEAVDALEQAEQLGRQAMGDIRRTVGLLESEPMRIVPEPGVDDIANLVRDFSRAGLAVELHSEGSTDRVSAAVGLALYRIAQESLANIAKHAPESNSAVRLVVSPRSADLSVTNRLLSPALAGHPSPGRGVAGMRQRVELLDGVMNVGPSEQDWIVHASIPLEDTGPLRPPWCKA